MGELMFSHFQFKYQDDLYQLPGKMNAIVSLLERDMLYIRYQKYHKNGPVIN